MPMYNFDPAEEQDDLLEQELLDHGREGSITGPNAKVGLIAYVAADLIIWLYSCFILRYNLKIEVCSSVCFFMRLL